MSKELHAELEARGLLDYGSVIDVAIVRSALGLVYPEVASKSTFDALALKELAAVDYVRNVLLDQGKYLSSAIGGYRILLPSENAVQVRKYNRQADKKLARAERLGRNTLSTNVRDDEQLAARTMLKRHSRRSFAGAVA